MAKEILKDEILKDEQLDQVAGGTHEETSSDMKYLYKHRGILWPQNWDKAVDQLGQMYYNAGMRLDTSERHANRYYLRDGHGGEISISHEAAFDRLLHSLR